MHAKFRLIPLLSAVWIVSGCDWPVPPGNWSNPLDPSGTGYHPPAVAIGDTAFRDPSQGRVVAHPRSENSSVVRVEWEIDGILLSTDSLDTVVPTAGWSDGAHAVAARATDARGLVGPWDTARVWIGNKPPVLTHVRDTTLSVSWSLNLTLAAHDPDGAIASFAWGTSPGALLVSSPAIGISPSGGTTTVWWEATDNDGASTEDSFRVNFVPAPVVRLELDLTTFCGGFGSEGQWTSVSRCAGSPLGFYVVASVPGFGGEPVSVTVLEGSVPLICVPTTETVRDENLNPVYGQACRFTEAVPATSNMVSFTATATNRFGATGTGGMNLSVR